MDANKPNISESDRNSILNHIINCANCALQNEDAFQKAMLSLATELRTIFDSEYCSIGIVDGDFAEECMISYEKFEDEELSKQQERFLTINRASVDEDKYIVCQALKSDTDIFLHEEKTGNIINNEYYQSILASGHLNNLYVIPLRDKDKMNFGFIQFINTKKDIDYERDIFPYSDVLLGLVQIIINNKKKQEELVKKENLLKDADFYSLMQDKRDNVDELLDSIMGYFSREFNAAAISFRIPILNGFKREPLFYLRRVFIHPSIEDSIRNKLIHCYNIERLVKDMNNMNIVNELRCDLKATVFESNSDSDFSQYGLNLDNDTLVLPIFRDFEQKCIHPQRIKFEYCKDDEHRNCNYRFKRLYGIFRLRISKTDLTNHRVTYHFNLDETKERLGYLSKQITLLINSIVNRFENESLKIFHNGLRKSSFIKINDFDKQCAEIIKQSVRAKACSIYRYDDRTRVLTLNATTAENIQFVINGMAMSFQTPKIQNSCFISTKEKNNILTMAFNVGHSVCVLNFLDTLVHQSPFIEQIKTANARESALVVPMIKKDASCAGVVLLLGKEEHNLSFSTSYWEHDIKHVEFIVNILTRISESDTERLTFLSQLSHELLAPVTEQVYDNDLTIQLASRNSNNFTKRQLINKLKENIHRNMLFKYIISDTEFIYSSTGRTIDYNIAKQEKPQPILLDAIRLMEKEAHAKSLSIQTHISRMPPLWFDKERMMQVFINLLKNAIRYSESHSTIRISYYYRENGFHEISFSNYGIGIQEKEKDLIFELFHRGDAVKKRFTRGTGMGLYIVRDIMRTHGGDCYVRHLDYPTEFVITLPNKN